ncbi:MAG: U32 family peptidase C-terminal domain-containing protein, partial [Phascolarctobacterium sp.]|nr:U32 family peptidase C-terminal domain-containing protein [Phascolarctobacterium sp.]
SSYEQTHDFVGIVTGYDAENKRALFEQRNNVKEGEVLELLMPDGKLLEVTLTDMRNADGEHIDCAPHAQMKFSIACEQELLACSLLRRKVK